MKRIFSLICCAAAVLAVASCGNSASSEPQTVDYEMSYTVDGVTFDMIKVPAGNFTMNLSSDNRTKVAEGTPHEVALSGYVISAQPVSQALWTAVMGSNPSSVQNPSAPVDKVSWNDAVKFIGKLNKLTGKTFSLPTEAQWEYACELQNGAGFGTVGEWCKDSYNEGKESGYLSSVELAVDPQGPKTVERKVVRIVKERMSVDSHTSKQGVGFRVAQPTEDALTEDFLSTLQSNRFDRETVDASDSKPETFTVGDVTFKMIKVKGGEFTMGYTTKDAPYGPFSLGDNEKNAHQVTLSDYEIGETEVTAALWNAVMGSLPYLNDIEEPQKPVCNVSWYNCQTFLRRLNALTGRTFRLPTEAEWEYAAKGGSKDVAGAFSGNTDASFVAWDVDNTNMKPKEVKGKRPNELGIYDMSGNVWEWCFDKGADYPTTAQTDPTGPEESDYRILRGGSAASKWDACRNTNRSFMPAKNIKGTFGLRLAL